MTLLDAADEFTRPLLATLAGAGLRIGEACALDWRHLDLRDSATLVVEESKTDAGVRVVDLHPGLREDLMAWKAASPMTEPTDPVFLREDRRGNVSRQTDRAARSRMETAIRKANVALIEKGIEPIHRASPHSLRRFFASLNWAIGSDSAYTCEQGGWEEAGFVQKVYTRRRSADSA